MILHLLDDPKFVNGAYDLFEEYYTGLNHFFVQIERGQKKKSTKERFFFKAFTTRADRDFIKQYAVENKIQHIMVHNLSPAKAALVNDLNRYLHAKTYWIFYGSDLYGYLSARGKYNLHDEVSGSYQFNIASLKYWCLFLLAFRTPPWKAFRKFIQHLNFFCFWNEYDFALLKKHLTTTAEFKFFLYYHLIARSDLLLQPQKENGLILVNHSASFNGNHFTVLKKLKSFENFDVLKKIIVPLSYGSGVVKENLLSKGAEMFGNKFTPVINFIPMDQYYTLLKSIPVAIFGHKRQEGAGNVFYLLSTGAKVFLRNENNMINWLKDKGFSVFSFEDDLNSHADLNELSDADKLRNQRVYTQVFSRNGEIKNMENLIA